VFQATEQNFAQQGFLALIARFHCRISSLFGTLICDWFRVNHSEEFPQTTLIDLCRPFAAKLDQTRPKIKNGEGNHTIG
jgi:acyl carrier protein phosphodiesterase